MWIYSPVRVCLGGSGIVFYFIFTFRWDLVLQALCDCCASCPHRDRVNIFVGGQMSARGAAAANTSYVWLCVDDDGFMVSVALLGGMMISCWGGNTRDLESYCSEAFVERLLVFISVPLSVNNVSLEREFSQFMDGIEMYFLLKLLLNFKAILKLIALNEWNEIRVIFRSSTQKLQTGGERTWLLRSKSLLHVRCTVQKSEFLGSLYLHLKTATFFCNIYLLCVCLRALSFDLDQFVFNL